MVIESKITSIIDEEYDNSLITIQSDLKLYEGELPNGKEKYRKIGNILSYYFDVANTINCEENVFDLFDIDGSFIEYYELLYENGSIKDEISAQMGDIIFGNLFLIQKVEILPKFRGSKYGHKAVKRLIQQFAHGVALIVLKPFPLQFEKKRFEALNHKSKYKSFVKDEKRAFAKIIKYWEEIGFQQIGNSDIWGINPL